MSFGPKRVLAIWGQDGLDFVNDLSETHGYERVPDPLDGETFEDYVGRCGRSGLIHIAGDMHNLTEVRARKAAEERGIPVYLVGADAVAADDEKGDDANAGIDPEWKGLTPTERFEQYKRQKNTPLFGTVVPEEQ